MSKNVFSGSLSPSDEKKLRQELIDNGFSLAKVQHAFWQAQKDRVFITFFQNGKIVIQGKNAGDYAKQFLFPLRNDQTIPGLESIKSLSQWIGTDESGKGDFFGPLVVAALHVNKKSERALWLLGVRDSKTIADQKIIQLASDIKKSFSHSVVSISPYRYNSLYEKYHNLNRLLTAAHVQVITNLVEKTNCFVVIADKFGDERLLHHALQDVSHLTLVQKNQAEINLAVAGASILAREKYIQSLDELSQKYEMNFPLGASSEVIEVAQKFVKQYGKEELKSVAKIHFKTMRQVL